MDRYYGFDLGDALETQRAPSHVLIKMTREFRGSSLWEKPEVL